MREAFLIPMNDFDRLLEFELRRMLDPVVASRVPPRKGRSKGKGAPFLAAGTSKSPWRQRRSR